MTDQQRYDSASYAGGLAATPTLDSLAGESWDATKAYAASPQCQPSRASLFTGKWPTAHHVWWNSCRLDQKHTTLPELLHGYDTAWFGKLDVLGRHGFGHAFTFEDWARDAAPAVVRDFNTPMRDKRWTGKLSKPAGVHHERVIVRRALDWLDGRKRPWFAGISFYGPHPPYAAPEPYCDMYKFDPVAVPAVPNGHTCDPEYALTPLDWAELRSQYFGMVSHIDDLIGEVLTTLRSWGVLEDTVIVFTSDHGDALGDHGLFSKGVYAYDGNVRVPLLIRVPGEKPARYMRPVCGVDVLPTVLGVLGLDVPPDVQGYDLSRQMAGNRGGRNSALSMIGWMKGSRLRMVAHGDWKYWMCGNDEKLFNTRNDKSELHDLSGAPECAGALSRSRLQLARALVDAEDCGSRPTRNC